MFKSLYHKYVDKDEEKYRDSLLKRLVFLLDKRYAIEDYYKSEAYQKKKLSFTPAEMLAEQLRHIEAVDANIKARLDLLKLYRKSLSKEGRLNENLDAKKEELFSQIRNIYFNTEITTEESKEKYTLIDYIFSILDEVYVLDDLLKKYEDEEGKQGRKELRSLGDLDKFVNYFSKQRVIFNKNMVSERELENNLDDDDRERRNERKTLTEADRPTQLTEEDRQRFEEVPADNQYELNSKFSGGRYRSRRKKFNRKNSRKCSKSKCSKSKCSKSKSIKSKSRRR